MSKQFHDGKRGLVLARKEGQSIIIEHGILEIQIMKVNGKQVRMKFIGNVRVDRAEKMTEGDIHDDNAETCFQENEET